MSHNNTSSSTSTNESVDESIDSSLQQFVLIDVRSHEDSEPSGGGIIPKALCMDPDFLDQPDALDAWIQHFDGTRGCNICIIDLPPGKATSFSLWKRLLLGEGDGFVSNNTLVSYGKQWNKKDSSNGHNNNNSNNGNSNNHHQRRRDDQKSIRDYESQYFQEEDDAIDEDNVRPAMKLAIALQKANFPNVCVLDGGFPSLVQQLISLRGTVEPLIINHNNDIWEKFLHSTGREKYSMNIPKPKTSYNMTSSSSSNASSDYINTDLYTIKTSSSLSELEVAEIAYQTALRLGHDHMATILQNKISRLTSHITGLDSTKISSS